MLIDRFTNRTAAELKSNQGALADVLREAGAVIKGKVVRCPFCDDKHPSAGIYRPNGDGWRYKCHKCGFGGSILDVIAKVDGMEVSEVFRRLRSGSEAKKPPKVYPSIEALKSAVLNVESVYEYTDPTTGRPDLIVIRIKTADGKTFIQARPQGGGFVMQAPDKPWPLYNRGRVRAADTVVVVEGEKCVHALHPYGIVATTSPGGALKALHCDWRPVAAKNAVLWPDNDEPGRAHMQQVEGILQQLEPAPRVSILEPADLDLGDKEDAADFIEQLETLHTDRAEIQAAILEALNKAKPRGIASSVHELIEDAISGRREAVKWLWQLIGALTKALLPGTVVILCGNVGASKSLGLLEAAIYWFLNGVRVAVYELEEDRAFHLSRCLAQKSGIADLTDPEWIKDNPEKARALFKEHETFLEGFGACIHASPDTQPTLEQLAKWVRDRAKAGCRIIAIDPITAAAHKGRDVWAEDSAFLNNIKRTAVDHRCSIVLVTHPVKAVSFPDVTQLAGGAAYQRFAQTILWLESHDPKASTVKTACGTTEIEHNRTVHILKARNGKGQGVKLACNFKPESLTLNEIGIIVKVKKRG